MGYTTGRRLTDELLYSIAKQYRTRSEFQQKDISAYVTCRNRGILAAATKHMVSVRFSLPQLICRYILDKLLGEISYYNTRKIIPPLELDIYYPNLKLAVEYNGRAWHDADEVRRRDTQKITRLKELGITLLTINERSRYYEDDIKDQLVENMEILSHFKLSKQMVMECKIDWDKIHGQTSIAAKAKEIQWIIANCDSAKQFRTQFKKEYVYVIKNKLHYLMKPLPKFKTVMTDEELLEVAGTYSDYSKFVKTKHYFNCHRRGILDIATRHMDKDHYDWKQLSNEHLKHMVADTKCKYPKDLRQVFPELHNEIKRRKIKIWHNTTRKLKNDPKEVALKVEKILKTGKGMGYIKRNNIPLYSSYMYHKRKGRIV